MQRLMVLALLALAGAVTVPAQAGEKRIVSGKVTVIIPDSVLKDAKAMERLGTGAGQFIKQAVSMQMRFGEYSKDIEIRVVEKSDGAKFIVGKTSIKIECSANEVTSLLGGGSMLVRARAFDLGRKDVPADDPAVVGTMIRLLVPDSERPRIKEQLERSGVLTLAELTKTRDLDEKKKDARAGTFWLLPEYWERGMKRSLSEFLALEPGQLPDPEKALKWFKNDAK